MNSNSNNSSNRPPQWDIVVFMAILCATLVAITWILAQ